MKIQKQLVVSTRRLVHGMWGETFGYATLRRLHSFSISPKKKLLYCFQIFFCLCLTFNFSIWEKHSNFTTSDFDICFQPLLCTILFLSETSSSKNVTPIVTLCLSIRIFSFLLIGDNLSIQENVYNEYLPHFFKTFRIRFASRSSVYTVDFHFVQGTK